MTATALPATSRLRAAWRSAFTPEPRLSVADWAEAKLVLSERTCPTPGPFRVFRAPYCRQPLDDFGDPGCEELTLCWAAQTAKTTIQMACVGYSIDHAPGPALFVFGNEKQAKSFSEERLQPLIEDCPALARHRTSNPDDFKKLEFHLDRMTLALEGSNSPTNLASRPIRYLFLDEPDKYPGSSEREAGAVQLAEKRTRAYSASAKIVKSSTPTIESGEIWKAFLRGNQCRYWVPCWHCETTQVLEWKHVKWPEECRRPDKTWDKDLVRDLAYYECPHCGGRIEDQHKLAMLSEGEWIAANPRPGGRPSSHRSYHLSALYADWCKFGKLAIDWCKANESGSVDDLKDFVQSTLAECWEERGEVADADKILAHRLPYARGTCPERPARLVLTADVQKHVCYWVVRGWARHESSWLVDYGVVSGLEGLLDLAELVFEGPNKEPLRITNRYIDSGAFTDEVYAFCRRHRWVPTKGFDQSRMAQPLRMVTLKKIHLPLLLVNVDHYKDALQSRLEIGLGDPGNWCLHESTGTDYSRHLTAEERISATNKKTGRYQSYWKQIREDNHWLDCEVLQLAAAQFLRVRVAGKGPEDRPAPIADPNKKPFVRRRPAPPAARGTSEARKGFVRRKR